MPRIATPMTQDRLRPVLEHRLAKVAQRRAWLAKYLDEALRLEQEERHIQALLQMYETPLPTGEG
jgi:hypothetical protein